MADDRAYIPCDRCGHRSTRDYVNREVKILSLCDHHGNEHRDALKRAGFRCVTDNDDDCDSNVVEAVA